MGHYDDVNDGGHLAPTGEDREQETRRYQDKLYEDLKQNYEALLKKYKELLDPVLEEEKDSRLPTIEPKEYKNGPRDYCSLILVNNKHHSHIKELREYVDKMVYERYVEFYHGTDSIEYYTLNGQFICDRSY